MNNLKLLPKLLVFASVARKGSFTKAAKELGITKSAVSQQVSALENELEERLLNRTTRGVSLTALGEKLLQRCQLLQTQVDSIFTDIADAGINPKGRFAVTAPHSLETNVVIPAIEQLCSEYTALEPELIVTDEVLDLIEHKLDVAIHIGDLPDSSYRAIPIGIKKEFFCATPLYLSKTSIPKTLDELCEHRWISTSWQNKNMTVYSVDNQEKISIALNQFFKVNTLPGAVKIALSHMGIVLLPDIVATPLLKTGELTRLLDNITGPHWPIHTIHAYQREKPVHITRFHQIVCHFFSQLQLD